MQRHFTLFLVTATAFLALGAQTNNQWSADLNRMLNEFKSCQDNAEDDQSPCNRFVGKALRRVYNIDDFGPDGNGEYLDANTIASYLATSDKWVFLGMAADQKTLNEAQDDANKGRAVVAVKPGDSHGHIAIVLPGELSPSANWKGLNCPNSASFFYKNLDESYVGKKLSYAFTAPDDVKIYGHETPKTH